MNENVKQLFEVVSKLTESEWYRASHVINRMFEMKNASVTSKLKLEDTEAMEENYRRL